jgi:hypothetical protein
MGTLHILQVWLILLATAGPPAHVAQPSADDSAVTQVAVAWGTGYVLAERTAILLDDTVVACGSSPAQIGCFANEIVDDSKNDMVPESSGAELKQSFFARNTSRQGIANVQTPVRIAPGADVRKAFQTGRFKGLEAKYPGLRHIVEVSAPGYTRDGKYALVYVRSVCDGRCGGYGLLLLERLGQKWTVVKPLAMAIG